MTAIWLDYFKNTDENKRKRKGFRLPVIIPLVLYNGRDAWTAKTRFKEYIDCAEEFGEYVVDFKYELIDVHKLEKDFIKSTNTLIDNILYADAMMNKEDWINHICEMRKRISYLSQEDENAWITWFLKAFERADEEAKNEFIKYFRDGDDKMCNSIEQVMEKEREAGILKGKLEGKLEGRTEEIFQSVLEGDYTSKRGAEKLGVDETEFLKRFEEWKELN